MLNKKNNCSTEDFGPLKNKKAITLIEVMIAIFVFTLWITSVFMLISSTARINTYNKNFIIASNLAREQIELIRNIRDTNYKNLQKWNLLRPKSWNYSLVFQPGSFYKIENWAWVWGFHIKSSTWASISDFETALKTAWDQWEENYRLCLDTNNNYIYCDAWAWKKTNFFKYIEISNLKDASGNIIKDTLKITSKVYWNQYWIHKVEIPTILADYKRL